MHNRLIANDPIIIRVVAAVDDVVDAVPGFEPERAGLGASKQAGAIAWSTPNPKA